MPKTKELTQKQKNFCHVYLETGNAAEAYLSAYNTNNQQTAYIEGARMLRRDDITKYIAEITKPTINKINNERDKKRNIIWKRIERCISQENDAGAARWMDILNKMDSEYININHNIDDGADKLKELDTDQLKKLLEVPAEETKQTE